ncbi:MAG: hypothetical protein IPN34_17790 [Planctomycetes bacterium]|nr:hypothetical protein [Planctomycetota bacterium]
MLALLGALSGAALPTVRAQQEGARDLGMLPFELGDVQLIESDADGYLYYASRLSGRFGDFSVLADEVVFRLDRSTWDQLVQHLREKKHEELTGPMPLVLRERRLRADAQTGIQGENFFQAWRDSWAGIFQDLHGSRVLVVRHSTGEMLRADSLYIGFSRSSLRAQNSEIRLAGVVAGKSVFLRLFADRLERGSDGAVSFQNARLTASEAPVPGYDVRCEKLVARPLADGSFDLEVDGARLALEGVEILPLPGFATNSRDLYLGPVQSVSGSASSKFGARMQALLGGSFAGPQDSVHRFLGLDGQGTANWTMPVEASVERGPAIDPTLEYELPGVYQGRFTTAYRHDPGEDVGVIRGGPDHPDRWRMRTQNRFFLSEDVRADLEVALRGDEAMVSEFYESEWKEDKEQETHFYLRYARGAWGGEFQTRPATNDFDTTLELLPEVRGHLISMPVFDLPFSSGSPGAGEQPLRVFLTAGGTLGQRQIQDGTIEDGAIVPATGFDGADAIRGTGSSKLSMPFWIGPISFTPYVAASYLAASDSLVGSGNEDRSFGEFGVATSTELSSPWGSHWTHRMVPEVRYSARHRFAGRDQGFLPLGVEEALGDEERVSFVLRNLWSENPRRRDPAALPLPVFDLDLDIDYYPDNDARPAKENWSLLHSEFTVDFSAMVGLPRFEIYSEADIDVASIEREVRPVPDAQYGVRAQPEGDFLATLEYRAAHARVGYPQDHDQLRMISTSLLYEASPKFDLELRFQYDLVRSKASDTTIVLRRKGADFLLELSFGYDPGENNTSVGFRFAPLLLYQRSSDNYARRTLPQGIGSL